MLETLLFGDYGPPAPVPDRLTFNLTPPTTSPTIQFRITNVVGKVEYDIPGGFSFTAGATEVLHGGPIPNGARKMYVTIKRNSPTGTARWSTETNNEIREIASWSEIDPTISIAFERSLGLIRVPDEAPPTTNWNSMFAGCWNFNQDLRGWNTAHVTNMMAMFNQATAYRQSINGWDTSNVTDMRTMFANITNYNGDISQLNVSKVMSIRMMFANCKVYNQNLSGMIFKANCNRDYYDEGCTAWLAQNKPKFTG